MKIISNENMKGLGIAPATCVEWIRESFCMKSEAQLPAKISLHPQQADFFNTMPCILPPQYHRFGVKIVHRIKGGVPALGGDILLYDSLTGELLAMLDSDWITTMRTGAVATVAIQTLAKKEVERYAFVGLGNTARATLLCLLDSEPGVMHRVSLLRYKDQADSFMARFEAYDNVEFTVVDAVRDLIANADVIVSCVTEQPGLFCEDDAAFRPGCLVVPVHTRGFQNCDLCFDKVFADDTAHVCDFKYFSQFKSYGELADVLKGQIAGRTNEEERILSYNIGLGLHDVYFAHHIYDLVNEPFLHLEIPRETAKFWV